MEFCNTTAPKLHWHWPTAYCLPVTAICASLLDHPFTVAPLTSKRTLAKFRVLEVVARVPYQAWEHAAYMAITHMSGQPDFARRIFERVAESREQQDNEQWHLALGVTVTGQNAFQVLD